MENKTNIEPDPEIQLADFAQRVKTNQAKLTSKLRSPYDFIVCGSGSSGAVVARRLAENPEVNVLLVEAGGNDDVPSVMEPGLWPANLRSERDWAFETEPNSHLNGRRLPMAMGKVLGGGSSINVMVWSRGHKNDWDYFAAEAGDAAWNYESVLKIYKSIEDWHGRPDPQYRGTGGLVYVQPAPDPSPIACAFLEGVHSMGMPIFDSPNGRMMETPGGCAIADLRISNNRRLSVFRTYTYPYMHRPNLTALTNALVTRLIFSGKRAIGVEIAYNGGVHSVHAGLEVVLSLGAINTPKVLMQSGIGDRAELRELGIAVVQHLPGVGQNFQDHVALAACLWEFREAVAPRNNGAEATFFWKTDPSLDTPDIQPFQIEFPVTSPEVSKLNPPPNSWIIFPGLVRPKSRGRISLTGANPNDPLKIHANFLEHPDDFRAMVQCVELCREIGNSSALAPFVKREVLPGNVKRSALENFIRNAAVTYWHQVCSAKMGRDEMSVVDANLKVYGIEHLRIADGSIMPRVTTGNTMAPCVMIGERAGEIINAAHKL